ncbi:MAG: pyruvate carboxylase subunit B, partial [Hoeflea sp.]|nr:pyruvate carboxylase subunit B [Hoeflea sp.]
MSGIRIIDTTVRDGQQSLWALNMRTGVMLTALERLDQAGYEAMEFFVPAAQIKKCLRDLNEDAFQWLRLGVKRATRTQLRLHGGYRTGIGKVPEAIGKLLVQKVIDCGITHARISDPWNDFDTLREEHD